MRHLLLLVPLALGTAAAAADEYRIEDVSFVSAVDPAQIKLRTILISDHRKSGLGDPGTGFIRFTDWARARPVQKQYLSLYPSYSEPVVTITVDGIARTYKEKLHVYVVEARFVVARPPAAIDLSRYATLAFLEKIDPAIKHRLIGPADVVFAKDAEHAHNRHPDRPWCETETPSICIESRYQLEGKLPLGIRLANRLTERKKIAEYIEFQSEIKLLSPADVNQDELRQLTGLDTPVTGALQQSIFHVNQLMQFGKFLAVLQEHPQDAGRTVATAFMALAVKSSTLERKKEFENVPVLRNLVPAQVLIGNSSFNTGSSISAGLPKYARNRIAAIAGILERD